MGKPGFKIPKGKKIVPNSMGWARLLLIDGIHYNAEKNQWEGKNGNAYGRPGYLLVDEND